VSSWLLPVVRVSERMAKPGAKRDGLNRVDLNLFVVFDTIYREKNLTRAADKLSLSQPAVSHALARLRENFDDPLFERAGKGVQPTPMAKAIVTRVRAALAELESAMAEGLAFDPAESDREFTIACRDAMESATLNKLMCRFQDIAPAVRLRSVRLSRRDMEAALANGRVDLAADVLLPVSDELRHRHVLSESLVVAMRRHHPLALTTWNLDAYVAADHILVSSRPEGPGVEDFALSRAGHNRNIRLRCQNYLSALQVISDTDMLLTLPETFAGYLLNPEKHVTRPLPVLSEPVDIHLYWHSKSERDPAIMWLRDQMLDLF